MPDPHATLAGADNCLLWTLPQELVCQIFDYAYGDQRVRWFTRHSLEWTVAVRKLHKAGKLAEKQKPPHFEYGINRFLVSTL